MLLNEEDAILMKLQVGENLSFTIDGQVYQVPVKISPLLRSGTAGLPTGLPGIPYAELPAWAILNRELKWKQQPQTTY
ncbi:hypothetical protein [Pontibacter sp. BAB1700]|uniref:hypothetical protein n=1 Tax=Pontibacter sp. BAB1700 TaxID=1144253 RepID=UPI0002D3785F|nr:hypothetical protein [Pontibacter sp. BAB1700]